MSYKLFLAPEAASDIAAAVAWYDKRRHRFGDIYLLALHDAFATIQRHPEIYAIIADDIRRASLIRFPYAIMYRIRRETIEILGVLHHKQHPDTLSTRT